MSNLTFFSHIDDACIHVTGSDSAVFLQGQLSCDINKVAKNHPVLGTRLDRKGRVIAIVWIWIFQEGYLVHTTNTLGQLLLADLQHYVLRSKVKLALMDAHTVTLLGIQGSLPPLPDNVQSFHLANSDLSILCLDTSIADATSKILVALHPEESRVHWRYALLKAGIPTLMLSTQGQYTPFELNIDLYNALDWKKGCYLGQEIVARVHYRGQIKKRAQLMHIKACVSEIFAGQTLIPLDENTPIAQIVDVVSCGHMTIAYVILPTDLANPVISYAEATLVHLDSPFMHPTSDH